tara:strand:- start:110 stop:289 length:180 start_codon:yes stop_codon:yes gene_type:complete
MQLPSVVSYFIVLFTQQYHLLLGRSRQQITISKCLLFLPPLPWAWACRQRYAGQQANQR